MNFSNKVVLITGASSGIGAATAVYLASLGAKLSLTARNESNLKKTIQECKQAKEGIEPFYVIGDISKEHDIRNILDKTLEKFGYLDILVNNAGFSYGSNLETITTEEYDSIFNTNVRGVLLLTKLAMPYLIESKGNVVNVSSVRSIRPLPGMLAYNMSKAALDQFTKCVALEVAPKGVRVNSVNPGAVVTNFSVAAGLATKETQHSRYEQANARHPIGRCGTAREIATIIAFLCSDLASNVTGSILLADGGSSLKN